MSSDGAAKAATSGLTHAPALYSELRTSEHAARQAWSRATPPSAQAMMGDAHTTLLRSLAWLLNETAIETSETRPGF